MQSLPSIVVFDLQEAQPTSEQTHPLVKSIFIHEKLENILANSPESNMYEWRLTTKYF